MDSLVSGLRAARARGALLSLSLRSSVRADRRTLIANAATPRRVLEIHGPRLELVIATLLRWVDEDSPAVCSCGASFAWSRAELVGHQVCEGETLELRNCPACGSTRAVELEAA